MEHDKVQTHFFFLALTHLPRVYQFHRTIDSVIGVSKLQYVADILAGRQQTRKGKEEREQQRHSNTTS